MSYLKNIEKVCSEWIFNWLYFILILKYLFKHPINPTSHTRQIGFRLNYTDERENDSCWHPRVVGEEIFSQTVYPPTRWGGWVHQQPVNDGFIFLWQASILGGMTKGGKGGAFNRKSEFLVLKIAKSY